jgi:hypothetical protein
LREVDEENYYVNDICNFKFGPRVGRPGSALWLCDQLCINGYVECFFFSNF